MLLMFSLFILITSLLSSTSSTDQFKETLESQLRQQSKRNKSEKITSENTVDSATFFDNSSSTEVTTLAGNTTLLYCKVVNQGSYTVSWIRNRDLHILTVGEFTYTMDKRFKTIRSDSNDWILQITRPNKSDEGLYECQVGSTPKQSLYVKVNVIESITEINGERNLYLKKGSSTTLECVVKTSNIPPDFILWYHDSEVVKYDYTSNIHDVVDVAITKSVFRIESAQRSNAGAYVCAPHKAVNDSITLYIVNKTDEQPAAMQHGKVGKSPSSSSSSSSSCAQFVKALIISNFIFLIRSFGIEVSFLSS
ncbi:Uncharacterised protein r2_g4211 [Pycnogonum litorale]